MFFFLNAVFLTTVLGQATDPTKVCLPDVFQSSFFTLDNHIVGVIAYDFPNGVIATRTDIGHRGLYNLSDYSGVEIDDTDGNCQKLEHQDRFIKIEGIQCLPATAALISTDIRHVGLIDSDNQFLGWRAPFPGIGNVTFAWTTTTPAIPVLREVRESPESEPQIVFFFNTTLGIDDKSIFDVPAKCSPASIIG